MAHLSTFLAVVMCVAGEAGDAPLTRRADLPKLLESIDGSPICSATDWPRRREDIRRLLCETFVGTLPQAIPPLIKAETLAEIPERDGTFRRRVKLTFATKSRASFETWIWVPPGDGPFPALLVAPRYYQIGWAEAALKRGYIVCLYPGVDSHHKEVAYPGYESVWKTFQAEYPEATWTEIVLKGWLASRTLDYLLDGKYGYPVAKGQVGIIGHSRYGKQALIAAAFDERITAVVARSSGTPASCPYRFASRTTFSEAPADVPAPWFLPGLGKFTGREDELPIDAHGWLALLAPRRCLLDTALHDDCDPTFAVERAYLEGREVYRLLGRSDNLRIGYRPGGHDPITDEHRRRNLDWFDLAFGRGRIRQSDFPEEFIHQFDWRAWKAGLDVKNPEVPFASPLSSDRPDGFGRRLVHFSAGRRVLREMRRPNRMTCLLSSGQGDDRRARILWSLGWPPEAITWDGYYTFLSAEESAMMSHDRWSAPGTARMPVSFGANVRGNLYYKADSKDVPAPVVIWLHPFSYPSGYNEAYGVQGTTVYHRLAEEGFVVLAYDQCGFGLRLLEGRDFYRHYPKWSRLGRMVYDVQAAVDFLVDGKGAAQGVMPKIRKDQVYVLGYSLGGMVGLYAAALDARIAGVACFDGFTPLRTDTGAKSTGGNRRLWQWHAFQPLLGLFDGRETEIPFDYDDLLAMIAPRPCLIYSSRRDRHADYKAVAVCVERSRKAWRQHDSALTHVVPDDVSRFQADQQQVFIDWVRTLKSDPNKNATH